MNNDKMLSETYKKRLQFLSGVLSENINKFAQLKQKMYSSESSEQLDSIFSTLENLPTEQKEIVKNTFIAQAQDSDYSGDLVFKLKKAISVFKK